MTYKTQDNELDINNYFNIKFLFKLKTLLLYYFFSVSRFTML